MILNFYQIVKENLRFNRFQYRDTVCLEYTCPIDAEEVGIFSRNDYLVYVLSGKKTYMTINGEWTLKPGQSLYLKKGAEIIHQYFDDEYCMLGFFLSDDLIRETFKELQGKRRLNQSGSKDQTTAFEIETSTFLEGYFLSMLSYFRGVDRPTDDIMVLKLKELLINLMNCDSDLVSYFAVISDEERPSLERIMENNFCFNLKLEEYAELCHRSLSTFKRDFQQQFGESPGKWLTKKRVERGQFVEEHYYECNPDRL
ncbi:MAG: AraC family transcriptional regulator [Saprospiraceae bacterium]|nr:AraC family transcriptional regulator [Saprospiraceae bacterium]MCB9319772.1 helix-turn-helix transcriptional regulator [Lewinellaceae bacterium]